MKIVSIYYQAGNCIMPWEEVFARVIRGGEIACGDPIEWGTHPDPGAGNK